MRTTARMVGWYFSVITLKWADAGASDRARNLPDARRVCRGARSERRAPRETRRREGFCAAARWATKAAVELRVELRARPESTLV